MKLNLKSVAGGAGALAIAGGMLLGGTGVAHAAGAPTYEPDPGAVGTVAFYDTAGHQITSGNVNDSPLAAYYKASGNGVVASDNLASVAYATPQDGVPTLSWTTVETWTSTQPYGSSVSHPGDLAGLPNAIVAGGSTDGGLQGHIDAFPSGSTANPNVYQVRIYTNHSGSSGNTNYYAADVQVNTTTGTWTQVYPTVAVVTPTSTTLTASPDPSTVGDTVTLTATESPATAGSIQFKDGTSNLGSPVAVDGTGKATTTVNSFTAGSHSLSAMFTPTDTTGFSGSTGTATATVNPPATPTTTALAVGGTPTTSGSDTTLTATVSPTAASGSVKFYDNGAASPIPGTVTNPSAGTYVLDLPTGFTAGSHSIVAKFTPTNPAQFQVSQSAPQAFVTQAPAGSPCDPLAGGVCTDKQYIQATVPVGTLVINTPYDQAHPLDLGTLALSSDTTKFSGTATFDNIKVTDTRAGNLPWTISALASNLSDGAAHANSVINAQNVGLTGLTSTLGTGFTGTVTPTDNIAANAVAPGDTGAAGLGGPTAHTVAHADHGLGTVTVKGTLTLNAPSSTEPGLFTGTITFTVG